MNVKRPGHRRRTFSVWWDRPRRAATSGYRGARVVRATIPRIQANVSRKAFFKKFVACRQPVVLSGLLPELAGFDGVHWPDAAQRQMVEVEVRDSPKDRFGRGRRETMRFGELLEKLNAGDTSRYLTTQEIPDGQLVAPPLSALGDSVLPLRPKLLQTLCPQSINLWLGRSSAPASSGLHHDFHDNLYCLLSGTKRFRLFSPADATHMQTAGSITRIHANGRINYSGDEPTAADGRTKEDAASEVAMQTAHRARERQRQAEVSLQSAEARAARATSAGERSQAARAVQNAEAALDDALDGVMEADGAARKRRRLQRKRDLRMDAEGSTRPPEGTTPKNFSTLGALELDGSGQLPAAIRGIPMAECELRAGEMLYLPCGWFHEVRSSGSHCALNYWFHPPDAAEFERPYRKKGFWRREWQRMLNAHVGADPEHGTFARDTIVAPHAAPPHGKPSHTNAATRIGSKTTTTSSAVDESTESRERDGSGSSLDAIFGYHMR